MKQLIVIPKGKLAADDDAALKRKREELKNKLLRGEKIKISTSGNVTGTTGEKEGIVIPKGKLANDDAALKRKREELKKKLLRGEKIKISTSGNVTGTTGEKEGIIIPKGKLALDQWYERDPSLLDDEIAGMQQAFPDFELERLDDGRLAWIGNLNVGVIGKNVWSVMAVYNNNHPYAQMGSSVRVYLIEPSIEELIDDLGWTPTHLLRSEAGPYLCTAQAEDIRVGSVVTSAASVLAWAVKWLMAFELVLTGDLPKEKFNEHGGI